MSLSSSYYSVNGSDIYISIPDLAHKFTQGFFMFLHQLDIDDNGDFGSYMLEVVKFEQ